MKKKELKQLAARIEKALQRAGGRLGKFPLNLADPAIFEVEGVSLDKGLLENVQAGLGRMEELSGKLDKELNDLEVLLVQLRHARRVSVAAKKAEEKAARLAKAEAKKQARQAKKAEAKAKKEAKAARAGASAATPPV